MLVDACRGRIGDGARGEKEEDGGGEKEEDGGGEKEEVDRGDRGLLVCRENARAVVASASPFSLHWPIRRCSAIIQGMTLETEDAMGGRRSMGSVGETQPARLLFSSVMTFPVSDRFTMVVQFSFGRQCSGAL